jgi:hypothetical protein
MSRWTWLLLIVLTFGFSFSDTTAQAASTRAMSRQTIRQMPLLARPYRPGHVYGNTVRWMAGVRR